MALNAWGEPTGTTRKRHYHFAAIDDCIRLRALKIYDRNNLKMAINSSTMFHLGRPSEPSSYILTRVPTSKRNYTGIDKEITMCILDPETR